MKFYLTVFLFFLGVSILMAKPSKRFSGFGVTGVMSNFGCVVTGGKLFINGLYTRNLTESEIQEMEEYKTNLKKFKEDREALIAQKSKGSSKADDETSTAVVSTKDNTETIAKLEPVKKPSFCNEESTTQYIFDGCKVQGGKVYIGSTYARDLNDTEKDELKKFDAEMSKYETYVQSNLQKQIEKLFGNKLSSLFLSSKNMFDDESSDLSNSVVDSTTTSSPGNKNDEEIKMPVPPNICTFIY
uniref:Pepsin-I3 domain-containing protein n=1 Tax=Strongyloides papillosus TaxID=174720 RepID=A0A0N5B3A6_STREA